MSVCIDNGLTACLIGGMSTISMNAVSRAASLLGGQQVLAQMLDITPQAVNQWVKGSRQVPVKRCLTIEALTRNAVTRYDLRPDIFGDPLPPPPSKRGRKPR